MGADPVFNGHEEALALQVVLQAHFARLSEERSGSVPLFALEHGLSRGELELLTKSLRWMVARGSRLSRTPLPLVVYATELGYEYDGGEYWDTFAAKTPGWTVADRPKVKASFEQFATAFGGVRPTGAWARHFSIICWPILHSVLPRIYQRQLASILYENRWRLSPSLIEDPLRLGTLIESWAWGASDRFRNLAQNRELLGQVASALLMQSSESSVPALLPATVERIIADLSKERDAKRWLREASRYATRTATKGFSPPQGRSAMGVRSTQTPSLNPVLRLHRRGVGWALVAELPEVGPLIELFPELGRELSTRRCHVTGRSRLLPRAALLWPGQQVEFDSELTSQPFLRLEGQTDKWTSLLGDFCQLPPRPWLFRIQDGEGTQVLGRFVRPGADYVVVPAADPSGVFAADAGDATNGLSFEVLRVPEGIDSAMISQLESLGLSVQSTLEVWPAGVCNAGWDGVGAAHWLDGDRVQVGVAADRYLRHLIVSCDGDPLRVQFDGTVPTFLDLGCLDAGTHVLNLEAFDDVQQSPVAQASLLIEVRPRHARPVTGSLREALMLTTAPSSPTLNELLDGSCSLDLAGPPGVRVDIAVSLHSGRRETALADLRFTERLPVLSTVGVDWAARLARQIHSDRAFSRKVEEADMCIIRFGHPDLGALELRAEREFAPIRLVTGVDHDGRYARLIDNMDGQPVTLAFRVVEHPDMPVHLAHEGGDALLRFDRPGLLTASGGEFETSVIMVADRVRDFRALGAGASEIRLARWERSVTSLRGLCRLASSWRHAFKPDLDASLTATKVLRAVTCDIAAGVGGKYWAAIEHRVAQHQPVAARSMEEALAHGYSQMQVVAALHRRIPHPEGLSQSDLVRSFQAISGPAVGQDSIVEGIGIGEFCLRLASQPASAYLIDAEVFDELAAIALENPVILRLARYLVIQTAAARNDSDDLGEAFRGFTWD